MYMYTYPMMYMRLPTDVHVHLPNDVHAFQRLSDAQFLRVLRQTVLGVSHRDLARFAHEARVLQRVAGDLVVQRLETQQKRSVPVPGEKFKYANKLFRSRIFSLKKQMQTNGSPTVN